MLLFKNVNDNLFRLNPFSPVSCGRPVARGFLHLGHFLVEGRNTQELRTEEQLPAKIVAGSLRHDAKV
jgi:hypothetical protein